MKPFTILLAILHLPALLPAQVYTKPTVESPSSSTTTNNSNSSTTGSSSKGSSNSPYGQEIPVFDPSSETITLFGQTYDIKDNRLGGQFEAYLASDAYTNEAAQDYREVMGTILAMISPNNPNGLDASSAFKLLHKASTYPGDANICDSLASSIYSASLALKGNDNKRDIMSNLDKEKQRIIYNMGIIEKRTPLRSPNRQESSNGNGSGQATTNAPVQSIEFTNYQNRLVEIEALKKKYDGEGVITLVQSKIQYQALMVQLFVQRRFEHVVIAARFYNQIFTDGDDRLRLDKRSDTNKFFTENIGVNPTIAGLDSAANEAIRKVQTLVNAFDNNITTGRTHSAAKRLTEAYAIGEFLPIVQTLPLEKKHKILNYVQKSNMLVQAISSKNFTDATRLNNELKATASDFTEAAKVESAIFAHTSGSDSFIQEAKFALLDKNMEVYKEALKNAIQLWPTNPKIKELQNRIDRKLDEGERSTNMLSNAKEDFDRLISDENYRKIFDRENYIRFASAFGQSNDTERLKQLEEIAGSFEQIEKSLAAAEELEKEGQTHAAWERLFEAQQIYYDDRLLNQEMARLSGEVATFTNALTRARSLETRENNPQSGSALSYYLKARRIHPGSKLAKEGIKRLVDLQFHGIESQPKTTKGKTSDDEFENF